MKLRRRTVDREGPFADTADLNPWLLMLRQMEALSPQPERTGFRTNQARYANRNLECRQDVGESFLLNTRMHDRRAEWIASIPEYFTSQLGPVLARSGSESHDGPPPLPLPDPLPLELPLGSVLERRRSVRGFTGDAMEAEDLATILHAAAGITHEDAATAIDRPLRYRLRFRSVPSAGGLYAVDCFCLALNLRGVPAGAYRYLAHGHALAPVGRGATPAQMRDAFMPADTAGVDVERAAACLVFVGNPQKVFRKYGDRGVRYLLLEAGMLAFAADLAATAVGWGALHYQSFYEPPMEACLGLRNQQHYALHALLLGWPATWATARGGER